MQFLLFDKILFVCYFFKFTFYSAFYFCSVFIQLDMSIKYLLSTSCVTVWDWSPFVANCQGSVQQEGGGSFERAVVFSLVLDRTGYSLSVGGTHRAWRGCRVVTGSRPWLIQTPTRLTRWGHQIGCEDKQANISVEAITNTQQWQCDYYVTFFVLYTVGTIHMSQLPWLHTSHYCLKN